MFNNGDKFTHLQMEGLPEGYEIKVELQDRYYSDESGEETYSIELYEPEDTRPIAFVSITGSYGSEIWGRWKDAEIHSKSLGNIRGDDDPEGIRAEAVLLGLIADFLEWDIERNKEAKKEFEIESQKRREREREEALEKRKKENELWDERQETCLWELIGDTIRVRERGKKVARLATLEVSGEGEAAHPVIRYASERDAACSTNIRFMRMLKVKEGRGYRVIWDDGDDDLPLYDRKSEY